jgi:hypothetical protein
MQEQQRESDRRTGEDLSLLEQLIGAGPSFEAYLCLKDGIANAAQAAQSVNRSDLKDVRTDIDERIACLHNVLESWRPLVVVSDEPVNTGESAQLPT